MAEWTIAAVCKTVARKGYTGSNPVPCTHMTERLMESHPFSSAVERNKAASRVCKRLFPQWTSTPLHGDLQRIIADCKRAGAGEDVIKQSGEWWLWARTLAIQNIFSKTEKLEIINQAVAAVTHGQPIHLVSARSPELVHAQVAGQGDPSLPRSRKAIGELAKISAKSAEFLPTLTTIVFADLAIDNLDEIERACDVETVIQENLQQLGQLCKEAGLENFQILRMSELQHPQGRLDVVLDRSGRPLIPIALGQRARNLIETATRESVDSHKRMFGWTKEQSAKHNENLAITMGLVGQAIQRLVPPPIIIHNEAFIARGALNNLFTPRDNPVPVICLATLLETKRGKE